MGADIDIPPPAVGAKAALVRRLRRSPDFSHSSSATSCSAISLRIRLRRSSSPLPLDDFPGAAMVERDAPFLVAKLFGLLDVFVFPSIDLDHVAFLDMEGNLHDRARLDGRGLGAA